MRTNFERFCIRCVDCGATTSKAYARAHNGQCKSCVTGVYHGPKCPDCGGPISSYKLARGYHCDACTKQADPIGWANEVRGLND